MCRSLNLPFTNSTTTLLKDPTNENGFKRAFNGKHPFAKTSENCIRYLGLIYMRVWWGVQETMVERLANHSEFYQIQTRTRLLSFLAILLPHSYRSNPWFSQHRTGQGIPTVNILWPYELIDSVTSSHPTSHFQSLVIHSYLILETPNPGHDLSIIILAWRIHRGVQVWQVGAMMSFHWFDYQSIMCTGSTISLSPALRQEC